MSLAAPHTMTASFLTGTAECLYSKTSHIAMRADNIYA